MAQIRCYDRSGDLRKGFFYRIEVPFDTDLWLRGEPDSIQWVVCDSSEDEYGLEAWIEVCVRSDERHECPEDGSHLTGFGSRRILWADLHGGSKYREFVRDTGGLSLVVAAEFGQQLLERGLRGLGLTPVPIRYSQAELEQIPEFCRVDFRGRNCVRPYSFRPPEPNVCPRCGFRPVVCPACSDTHYFCPECLLNLIGFSTKPHDRPFTAEVIDYCDFIVEADQWDGSDFFSDWYITRRALRALMDLKAEPFVAKPVWANVERLTGEQLAALEAM